MNKITLMVNFSQFKVVEEKIKIAPAKFSSQNILATRSLSLLCEIVHHRARRRAKK